MEARDCTEATWPDETYEDDCKAGVRRGACYLAFPQCGDDDMPQPTCSSFCVNERIACRTMNSNFGTTAMIEGGCSAPDWYDGAGPSPHCTGGAALVRTTAVQWLFTLCASVCVALVAASVTPW